MHTLSCCSRTSKDYPGESHTYTIFDDSFVSPPEGTGVRLVLLSSQLMDSKYQVTSPMMNLWVHFKNPSQQILKHHRIQHITYDNHASKIITEKLSLTTKGR